MGAPRRGAPCSGQQPAVTRTGREPNSDWERTVTDSMHDVVILGGGSGGYACALRASLKAEAAVKAAQAALAKVVEGP